MKRVLLAISFLMVALSMSYAKDVEFVDLGLPSGTKWAATNEKRTYTFYEAVSVFHRQMPTEAQFDELFNECDYKIDKKGILLTGKNGNSIYLSKGTYHCIPSSNKDSYTTGLNLRVKGRRGKYYGYYWGMAAAYHEWLSIRRVIYPDSMPTPPVRNLNIVLSLSSRTRWKAMDEEDSTTSMDNSINYQDDIPLLHEWEELLKECKWKWMGHGYIVYKRNIRAENIYIPVSDDSSKPRTPAEYIYKHYRINPRQSIESSYNPCLLKTRLISSTKHIIYRLPFDYVNMGLPSGVKWGSYSEPGIMTWDEAVEKYGANNIPSIENFKELFNYCKVEEYERHELLITAPNGNQILMKKPYVWTITEKYKNIDGVQAIWVDGDTISYFLDGKNDCLRVHLIRQ